MKPQGTQLSLFETRSVQRPIRRSGQPARAAPDGTGARRRTRGDRGTRRRQRAYGARFRASASRPGSTARSRRCGVWRRPASPCRRASSLPPRARNSRWNGARDRGAEPCRMRAGSRCRRRMSGARAPCCRSWLKRAAYERWRRVCCIWRMSSNYSVSRVSIRCQRTRWGSCSTRGTVSLNCSLVFLKLEVVRYLFVHELAHTKHMNHSANFWRLVEKDGTGLPAPGPGIAGRLAHRARLGVQDLSDERNRSGAEALRRFERRAGTLGPERVP